MCKSVREEPSIPALMSGQSDDPAAFWRPDWRTAENYAPLMVSDRRSFAWEWLRRTPDYRDAWLRFRTEQVGDPGAFGLLGFQNPDLPAATARPIWSMLADPHVLNSNAATASVERAEDLLDIRMLAPFVTVEIGANDEEHWLLSDGRWVVRLDLHEGTLLGGPALLVHRLDGLAGAEPQITALRQLIAVGTTGEMPRSLIPREPRAARWILELRTADARAAGATQHEIARALFGAMVASERWRIESGSFRLRVQRLTRMARARLEKPLDDFWFR